MTYWGWMVDGVGRQADPNMLSATGEFKIVGNSPLIGRTIEDIETKYGVVVIHTHKGLSEILTRSNPSETKKIEAEEYLKIEGSHENVMQVFHLASEEK